MIHLLDVNALIALGFMEHEFHGRISSWIEQLPRWAKAGKQTTIGHLVQLAKANHAFLTTFDKGIACCLNRALCLPGTYGPGGGFRPDLPTTA